MNITHHLSDETLIEYASGNLNEALEVVVASHLTLCSHCRQRSHTADHVGGHLLDATKPVEVSHSASDLLNRLRNSETDDTAADQLQSLKTTQKPAQETDNARFLSTDVPRPLARRIPADLDALPWSTMAKGIKHYTLRHADGSKSNHRTGAFKLLKLQPGVKLIEHSHGDIELTLVLKGSYSDSTGRYGVGDVADLGADVTHCPVIDSNEPCIAVVATNSPAQYTGMVGRIMQPFIGI